MINQTRTLCLFSSFILLLFILSACGGGSDGTSNSNSTDTGDDSTTTGISTGLSDLKGIITLDEFDNLLDKNTGVVSFNFSNGVAERGVKKASGKFPDRHLDGRISYVEGCGTSVTRVLVRSMDGITTPVTPCGSELVGIGYGAPHYFEYSKISPNGKYIAAEVRHFNNNIDWVYSTLVYELTGSNSIGNEVVRYEGVASPEWLPDNRLMLIPTGVGDYGIYISDVGLNDLERIDNNQINVFVNNTDVSPSGEDVIFEYNQQIWIMDMDGLKIEPLIVSGSYLRFPTWSPDGKYVAFLLKGQLDDYHNEIQFYDVKAKKVIHVISTDDVFAPGSYGTYPDPKGPLSWINAL